MVKHPQAVGRADRTLQSIKAAQAPAEPELATMSRFLSRRGCRVGIGF